MSPLSAARAALRVYAAGAAVILAQLLRRCRGGFLEPGFPRQPDRVAIVTGGTDGIGYSTAKHLARLGMHVIIVEFLYCDLASMMSIRQFVQKFKMKKIPLHVLINNAGVMMVPQRKTRDGFEEHFGLNYLGHFLLTNLLLDTLRESGSPGHSARVLTVSSATHYVAELNMDDLQSRPNVRLWRAAFCYPWLPDETAAGGRTESLEGFNEGVTAPRASNSQMPFGQRRGTSQKISAQVAIPPGACYSAHAAYAQSKLALVLFTYHLQRLLAAEGSHVTANVVDPGVVNTDLYRHVFWGTRLVKKLFSWLLFKTPDEGAWTSIYAAVTPELEGVGGRYLYNEKETKSLHVTYNQKLQQQLWSASCDMTGSMM
ncbi:dehydrogenase/reductase SDR family member on chromosome X isoform X2 [Trachypithecus francoisi]|uniref:dehydrogenase/reductase SDR family member on chromosome X isoform X2 n=1 Tax=Trachypithecus francoisi TaxID=54180 RepID=UPI00141B1633|nr:dehydrogenase/reductase SDR family member on chromosome X isoform X2 [Trachypithecus francoisi]